MRKPTGLGTAGSKLWRTVTDTFDFEDEPAKVHILEQACRVADIVAELDEAANEAPLTVRGSMGQPVISPFIAEARAQRALLAQLVGRLGLPDNDEDDNLSARRIKAARTAANARWGRGSA
nr:hypothetical protein BJP76_07375 [Mycobacterium avium subsp. hominissuis]